MTKLSKIVTVQLVLGILHLSAANPSSDSKESRSDIGYGGPYGIGALGIGPGVGLGGFGKGGYGHGHHHPKYHYSYGVSDKATGDFKQAFEHREGPVTKGSYSVLQPDGVLRVVNYVADPLLGFQAQVVNKGVGHHAPFLSHYGHYGHGGHSYGHAGIIGKRVEGFVTSGKGHEGHHGGHINHHGGHGHGGHYALGHSYQTHNHIG